MRENFKNKVTRREEISLITESIKLVDIWGSLKMALNTKTKEEHNY